MVNSQAAKRPGTVAPATPAAPVVAPPAAPQRTLKGLIQNAGQEIVNLTVGTGKAVAGAGFEAARAVKISGQTKQSKKVMAEMDKIGNQLKTEKNPQKIQALKAQLRAIQDKASQVSEGLGRSADVQNPFIDIAQVPKSFQEMGTGILRNLGDTVGLTTDQQGNAVFDLELAIQHAYENPISTALLAKDAASGVKKLAKPKTAVTTTKPGLLQKTSSRLRKDTLNPQVDASPYYADDVQASLKLQEDLGLEGSATVQLEQLNSVAKKTDTTIRVKLQDAPAPKRGTLSNQFQKEVADANYGIDDPLFAKAIDNEAKILSKLEGTSATAVYEQMGKYRKLLKSTYKKIDNGTTLLPKEEARLAAFNALKETLDTVSPEVKVLNTLQHKMWELSEGLVKSSEKPGVGVGPVRLPGEETQFLKDKLATGLDKVGEVQQGVAGIANKAPGAGVALAADEALLGRQPDDQSQQPGPELQGDIQDDQGLDNLPQDTHDTILTQQDNDLFGGQTKEQLLKKAFQQGASAQQLDEIAAVYDRLAPQAGGVVSEDMQKAASELRKEYIGQTRENGYMDVVNAYRKVASAEATAAGDVSLIFAYMKMLDPGSTVREGEFATAEQTAGIPDRIVTQYNKALKGDRLGEKQRADFKSSAKKVFDESKEVQSQIDKVYTDLAGRYGVDPTLLGIGAIGIDD